MRKRILFICCLFLGVLTLYSCGEENSSGKTTITFFGWGNETEVALTEQFVNEYNESQEEIYVKYTSIPSEDYATKIGKALRSKNPPDVLIAGDGEIKHGLNLVVWHLWMNILKILAFLICLIFGKKDKIDIYIILKHV